MVDSHERADVSEPTQAAPPTGAAFLLAQLGAHAAARFAERTAVLELTPAQTGLLRLVARRPGRSQQAIAAELGVAPSRMVTLIDDLQDRDLVQRRRSTTDRRNYELHLTESGKQTLGQIRKLAIAHEEDLTAALDSSERQRLAELLQCVADQQGLQYGVHPGYKTLHHPEHGNQSRTDRATARPIGQDVAST